MYRCSTKMTSQSWSSPGGRHTHRKTHTKSRMNLRAITLIAVIPLLANVTVAQEEPDDNEAAAAAAGLEEVVVTATKRETNLLVTPLAVSAVSQEQLTDQNVSDVTNLGDLVPNMQVGASPSDSGVQVTVRGITSNNFTELGDPTVAIHVDGMYSPRPQAGLALLHDVSRVEILRGPQGTLFGRNSTSGSINIVTSRPRAAQEGSIEADISSFNRRTLRGWYNFPLTDAVAFRVSAMVERADSYLTQVHETFDLELDIDNDGTPEIVADGIPNTDQRRNVEVDDGEAYFATDRYAIRLTVSAGNDRNDLLATFDHFQDNSPGGISLKDCDKAKGTFFECEQKQWYASINVPGVKDFNIQTLRLQHTLDFDTMVMENRIALSRQSRFQQFDGDAGAWADPDHPGYGLSRFCCGGFPPLVRDASAFERLGFPVQVQFPFEDLQLTTRYSQYDSNVWELQFKSTGSTDLNWIAGFFAMQEKNSIRFDVELPFCCTGGVPLAQSFVQPNRQVKTQAVFGQVDYSLNERTNVTVGYRQTWDTKSDKGGSNHSTIGYWVNPGLYDPTGSFWFEAWGLIGIDPTWSSNPAFYQADKLTDAMGSLAEDFIDRVPGTDNTYEADWNKGTWRLGFDYLIDNNTFLYGYAASGFKSGGFGDKVDVCECGEITAFPYDPEEVTTYELGLKRELLDGDLRLMATAFMNDYNDMQRTSWVIVGESIHSGLDIGTLLTTNLAEADIMGVEIELDWSEPWQGGRIFGWLSFLNAEISNLEDGSDGLFCFERAYLGLKLCPAEDLSQPLDAGGFRRPVDLSGNKLPWSPSWSLSATLEHNEWVQGGWIISPAITANWQAEMFFNDVNYDDGPFHAGQEAVLTFNGNLKFINENHGYAIVVFGYNLTDKLVRSWADPGPGYWRANFFPPRSVGIRASKAF